MKAALFLKLILVTVSLHTQCVLSTKCDQGSCSYIQYMWSDSDCKTRATLATPYCGKSAAPSCVVTPAHTTLSCVNISTCIFKWTYPATYTVAICESYRDGFA